MMPPILPDLKILVVLAGLGIVFIFYELIMLIYWLATHVTINFS